MRSSWIAISGLPLAVPPDMERVHESPTLTRSPYYVYVKTRGRIGWGLSYPAAPRCVI